MDSWLRRHGEYINKQCQLGLALSTKLKQFRLKEQLLSAPQHSQPAVSVSCSPSHILVNPVRLAHSNTGKAST